MTPRTDLPKPLFPQIGRLYDAVVAANINPGSLNRDQADTVVRILARTNWKNDNMDIYNMWNAGGDHWGQLIKDVKDYSKKVSAHQRKSTKTPPTTV
jgi:hypothetical protein